jgi:hypothetical protein
LLDTGNLSGPHPGERPEFAGLAITTDPGIARRRVGSRNPENPARIFSFFPDYS